MNRLIALLALLAPAFAWAQFPEQIITTPGTADSAASGAAKINYNFNYLNGLAVLNPIAAGTILCNSTAGLTYASACGNLPAGVTIGAAQITAGTLASGVTLGASQVTGLSSTATTGIAKSVYAPGALVFSGSAPCASVWVCNHATISGTASADSNGNISPNVTYTLDSVQASSTLGLVTGETVTQPGFSGGRIAMNGYVWLHGTPSITPGAGMVGTSGLVRDDVGLNGTDGYYSSYRGNLFGAGSEVYSTSSAPFVGLQNGEEFDTGLGQPTADHFGISIVHLSSHAYRGVYNDIAIDIDDQDGATAPWLYGIGFGDVPHLWAFGSDSSLIHATQRTLPTLASTPLAHDFIDGRAIQYTSGGGGPLLFPNAGIDNTGQVFGSNLVTSGGLIAETATVTSLTAQSFGHNWASGSLTGGAFFGMSSFPNLTIDAPPNGGTTATATITHMQLTNPLILTPANLGATPGANGNTLTITGPTYNGANTSTMTLNYATFTGTVTNSTLTITSGPVGAALAPGMIINDNFPGGGGLLPTAPYATIVSGSGTTWQLANVGGAPGFTTGSENMAATGVSIATAGDITAPSSTPVVGGSAASTQPTFDLGFGILTMNITNAGSKYSAFPAPLVRISNYGNGGSTGNRTTPAVVTAGMTAASSPLNISATAVTVNTNTVPVVSGSVTTGHCVQWASSGALSDPGAACGTGGGTTNLNTSLRYIAGQIGNGQTGFSSSNIGETDRIAVTTSGPISKLQLFMPITQMAGGVESATGLNTVFHQASVEYPSGVGPSAGPPQFTLAGNSWMAISPTSTGVLTDTLSVNIPAHTTFYIRYGTFTAQPPASLTAAAATGGSLTAGTYYYEATCVRFGAESGPTSEVSQAASGGNLTINLTMTATAGPVGCDTIKIYRSTSTGTETYLASVQAPGLNYSDNGAIPTVAAFSPPAAQSYVQNSLVMGAGSSSPISWWTNAVNGSGNGANIVNAFGTSGFNVNGPKANLISVPLVLGDDVLNHTVCAFGDSIMQGSGIQPVSAANAGGAPQVANWFDSGASASGFNDRFNGSLTGTKATAFTNNGYYGTATRMNQVQFCDYILMDLSINDVANGEPWYTIAEANWQTAQWMSNRGKKVFLTTLLPYTTSTDNDLTTANQTRTANESVRLAYNAWVRDGLLFTTAQCTGSTSGTTLTISACSSGSLNVGEAISSGSAPQNGLSIAGNTQITALGTGTGGAGTYTINNSQTVPSGAVVGVMPVTSGGAASTYISGYFDLDNAVGEVNVNNVQTPNGGYWPAPCSTNYSTCQQSSSGGGTLTGTPTTSSLPYTSWTGASNAQYALINYLVKMTSGAAIGQTCLINNNTTSTITCNGNSEALTTAPSAGDTFVIYQPSTQEGIHPTIWENAIMATGASGTGFPNFSTWATANFVGIN